MAPSVVAPNTYKTSSLGGDSGLRLMWSRAAVLGSLWASFEIVVGSFLHNLRVPFAGTVLTAIGVMILVAGQQLWIDRRLLWRAALVCALMKSISPSAIIFGPMVGIFMEGLLLFVAVRFLGNNLLGYSVGGALAGSWPLGQKILSFFLVYGSNIGRLYIEAYQYAAKSLGISKFGAYDLLMVLFAFQSLVGIVAAIAAWKIGRLASTERLQPMPDRPIGAVSGMFSTSASQRYSLVMLGATIALLLTGFWITNWAPLAFVAIYVGSFVVIETVRYPGALRRLGRRKLWIEIAAVMLLSGLMLGGLQRGGTWSGGLAIGGRMGLRAVLVIVGFTAVSIELRSPRVLGFLSRKRLSNLSTALQSAFGVLPNFMAALSQRKQGWRRPLRTLTELVVLAESLQSVIPPRLQPVTVLITGSKGKGKTTLAGAVVRELQNRGYSVAGILSRGLWKDGTRSGFDIVDVETGQVAPLARIGEASNVMFGPFSFFQNGLRVGQEALCREKLLNADVVIVDEIGRWEMEDGGWAPQLNTLRQLPRKATILVVRDQFADEVANRWGRGSAIRFLVPQTSAEQVLAALSANA